MIADSGPLCTLKATYLNPGIRNASPPVVAANDSEAARNRGRREVSTGDAAHRRGEDRKGESTQWPTDSTRKFKAGTTAVPDGYVLPIDMYDTFAAGRQNDVPPPIGYNANEGGDVLWEPLKAAAYEQSVREQCADLAVKILDLYPATSDTAATQSQMNLLRDNGFGWHMWT